jgi:RNA ligase (TIGR02306 family)
MSTHRVDILAVMDVINHPNADALEIIKAFDYECIVKKGEYKPGDLFAFIEPDNLVDAKRPEFSFLLPKADNDGMVRIRSIKLRGFRSYGLVIPAPKGAKEGDNLWDALGVVRYEPKAPRGQLGGGSLRGGLQVAGPNLSVPTYDLENFKKNSKAIAGDENVIYSVKLHGSSYRAVFHNDEFFIGSRTTWKMAPGTPLNPITVQNEDGTESVVERVAPESTWWTAAQQNPWLEEWCRANPGVAVYGELYGPQVQGEHFAYGKAPEEFGIAIFDALENGRWVDNIELHTNPRYASLHKVPVLHTGPHDKAKLTELAELPEDFGYTSKTDKHGKTHIREGIVVKPYRERYDSRVGRVALKFVSDQYLDRT